MAALVAGMILLFAIWVFAEVSDRVDGHSERGR